MAKHWTNKLSIWSRLGWVEIQVILKTEINYQAYPPWDIYQLSQPSCCCWWSWWCQASVHLPRPTSTPGPSASDVLMAQWSKPGTPMESSVPFLAVREFNSTSFQNYVKSLQKQMRQFESVQKIVYKFSDIAKVYQCGVSHTLY